MRAPERASKLPTYNTESLANVFAERVEQSLYDCVIALKNDYNGYPAGTLIVLSYSIADSSVRVLVLGCTEQFDNTPIATISGENPYVSEHRCTVELYDLEGLAGNLEGWNEKLCEYLDSIMQAVPGTDGYEYAGDYDGNNIIGHIEINE